MWIMCWIININYDKCVDNVISVEINDVVCCDDSVVDYCKFWFNVIFSLNSYWWIFKRGFVGFFVFIRII